ncbi:MAG: hypothetical protein J6J00_03240 [Treponema sp.]|nr:hypothetical protein [Treponema sp.]
MKIKTFLPLYVAAFLFLSSCDSSFSVFSGNQCEELLLELPSWPPSDDSQVPYPELSRWLIQIENTGSSTCQAFSTNESFISITLDKNAPAAITATPLTTSTLGESAFFMPAGLIYPAEKEQLTWEGGFMASLLQKLIKSREETGMSHENVKTFLSTFNWKKAQESISQKVNKALEVTEDSSSSFYNPWLLDSSSILENISLGDFKASLLNNSECFTFSTQNIFQPILSAFIPENAFIASQNSVLLKKNCPSLFYSTQDCGIIIEGSSEKNISVSICKLPIFLKDTTIYEEKSTINDISHFSDSTFFLCKKRERD